jgi:hypothetical protein
MKELNTDTTCFRELQKDEGSTTIHGKCSVEAMGDASFHQVCRELCILHIDLHTIMSMISSPPACYDN